jgi:hypothetical protein
MSLWTVNSFISAAPSDGGSTCILTLRVKWDNGSFTEVRDNTGMSKALHSAYFYPPPENDGIDPDFVYPPLKAEFSDITDEQIHHTIRKLKPYKAVKSPIPFRPRLNNTSVYWLNSKVHPGVMAVKGEKELSK